MIYAKLAARGEAVEFNRQKDHYYNKGGKQKKQEQYRQTKRTTILKNRYGITEADYDLIFKKQNGCCAICGVDYTNSSRNLDVDHCHETKIVRGLLCNNCNRGIGHLQDDPIIINKALDYLCDISGKGGSCGV